MSIISILYCDFSCQYHFLTIWLCISCAPTKFGPNYHSDTQSLHPKSKFMNCQVTAIFFNFPPKSWQRTWKERSLHCHVHITNIVIFGQLLLEYWIFFIKIPFWHQIFTILMIYALFMQNVGVTICALFPSISYMSNCHLIVITWFQCVKKLLWVPMRSQIRHLWPRWPSPNALWVKAHWEGSIQIFPFLHENITFTF